MRDIIKEDIDRMLQADFCIERLKRKTILITGATGYVPAYFVHYFMALNERYDAQIRVLALCRNENKANNRFAKYFTNSMFQIVLQDVCSEINIKEKVDFIIHAASPAGVKECQKNILDTYNANVKGCYNVCALANKNNAEGLLFVSSVDVYGWVNTSRHIEDVYGVINPLDKRDVYSNAKRACESMCMCECIQNNLQVTIARPTQIIGPGIDLNDGRLHADFVNQMIHTDEIVLKSDGTAIRSFIYITDAIMGMLYILLYGEKGHAYNVANERNEASVRELAEVMIDAFEDKKIQIRFDVMQRNNPEVAHALSVVCADAQKLRNLGWNAEIDLYESAKRLILYCKSGENKWQ